MYRCFPEIGRNHNHSVRLEWIIAANTYWILTVGSPFTWSLLQGQSETQEPKGRSRGRMQKWTGPENQDSHWEHLSLCLSRQVFSASQIQKIYSIATMVPEFWMLSKRTGNGLTGQACVSQQWRGKQGQFWEKYRPACNHADGSIAQKSKFTKEGSRQIIPTGLVYEGNWS